MAFSSVVDVFLRGNYTYILKSECISLSKGRESKRIYVRYSVHSPLELPFEYLHAYMVQSHLKEFLNIRIAIENIRLSMTAFNVVYTVVSLLNQSRFR